MSLGQSAAALPKIKSATATAGLTQTQAGSVALTGAINQVTTGNANDGVNLPRADAGATGGAGGNCVDGTIIVENVSAVILKVYPFYDTVAAAGDGSQINAGGANTAFAQPASSTYAYSCTAAKTWRAHKLS